MQTNDGYPLTLVEVDSDTTGVTRHDQTQDGHVQQNGGEWQAAFAVPHDDAAIVGTYRENVLYVHYVHSMLVKE